VVTPGAKKKPGKKSFPKNLQQRVEIPPHPARRIISS
jgi:hypothetical protein